MDMYFPRYLIDSTMTACFAVVMKCIIFSFAKGATCMRQNNILIFYINTFRRKYFTKGPIATLYCDVPTEKLIFKGE